MNAAMDLSITEEEYIRIAESSLEEMERIGITDRDMEQIGSDVFGAMVAISLGPYIKSVG
jgi:hypothetical protein